MNAKWFSAVFAVTGVLLTPVVAAAQTHGVEIAAGGGSARYTTQGTSGSTTLGKGVASLAYYFDDTVCVGVEGGFAEQNLTASEGDSVASGSASATSYQSNYGAFVHLGYAVRPAFIPYLVLAGGGAADYTTSSYKATSGEGTETGTSSYVSNGGYLGGGLGIDFRLRHWGLRTEARYVAISFPSSGNSSGSSSSGNELDVTGSLFYTFGGKYNK